MFVFRENSCNSWTFLKLLLFGRLLGFRICPDYFNSKSAVDRISTDEAPI
jgi:hypothetical protein